MIASGDPGLESPEEIDPEVPDSDPEPDPVIE